MLIIQPSDFKVGRFKIAQNNVTIPDIQDCIDEWEKYYIYQLLSNNAFPTNTPPTIGLSDLFIADVTAGSGTPLTARFLKIFNIMFEQDGQKLRQSKGIKYILKACIFYQYIRDNGATSTQSGVANANVDGGNKSDYLNQVRYAEKRWNEMLESADTIRWWLKAGNDNGGGNNEYPEYVDNGVYYSAIGATREYHNCFTPKFSPIL
jgi:hypothetical protein